jgi:hypothetical protein
MRKSKTKPKISVPITTFDVLEGGTLLMADHEESQTRAQIYEDVVDYWSSPAGLLDCMSQCRPLAWEVHSIYSELREDLTAEAAKAHAAGPSGKQRLKALNARLRRMPEEPEDGVTSWVLALSAKEFGQQVEPAVEKWLESPADDAYESDYLPPSATAQGAALQFFQSFAPDELEELGVLVVEGEHPGSSYYAAELRVPVHRANKTAVSAGMPVRFRSA